MKFITKYPFQQLLLALLCMLQTTADGQTTWRTDSLKTELFRAESDTAKARLACDLGYEFYNTSMDSSLRYGKLAEKYATNTGEMSLLAQAHNTQGICYLSKASVMNALEQFQKAYELYHQVGDKRGEAKILNNLGVIYTETEDYKRATEKYEVSFQLNDELGFYENASNALYNIANNQLLLKNLDEAKRITDDLREYEKLHPGSISSAPLYGEIFLQKGQLDSAKHYLELSVTDQENRGDLYNWSVTVLSLARVVLKMGHPQEAMQLVEKTHKCIQDNEMMDAEFSYLTLKAEILHDLGLPEEAYLLQAKALELNDSIEHNNQMNMINDMNTKYETDRMEEQISEQKGIIESKQMWLVTIIIFMILLSIGLFAVIYVLRRNKRLNNLLKVQNTQINHQRQKIISSINYAKRIQQSTLPKEHEFKKLFTDSFIYFKPKDIISGDFYAYQQIGQKIYVAAVDCTGHGVPGAFMSLIANAKLNKVVNEMGERDPGRILAAMHKEIQIALHQEQGQDHTMDGVEMSLCAIDVDNQLIEFAGAGSSIFVVRKGEIQEYKGHFSGLGGLDYTWKDNQRNIDFTTQKIAYEPSDLLYLFSDGMHDQIGGTEMKKLNKTQFKEHLLKLSGSAFDTAVHKCEQFITDWRNNHHQTDDMMLIGIKL